MGADDRVNTIVNAGPFLVVERRFTHLRARLGGIDRRGALDAGVDLDQDFKTFKTFKADLLSRHEQAYFERLMERVEGNISRGAREAGISRTYLLTMLRRYGIYESL